MIRRLLIVAAVAAAAAVAAVAALGGVIRFTVVVTGGTESSTGSQPAGFVVVTKAQETRLSQRLAVQSRAVVARTNLQQRGLVAVFLYGLPCARDVKIVRISRLGSTITVAVAWTRPPPGMALCVRLGTPYIVVSVPRAALGRPAATHVVIDAVARA